MNALYKDAWVPLQNYFCPVMKLVEKKREGSRWAKAYDTPATPCQRLLNCPVVPEEEKEKLRSERARLDPIGLSEAVEKHLGKIARLLAKIAREREEDDELCDLGAGDGDGACCLIKKDTLEKTELGEEEPHYLIKEDTVAHGRAHESKQSKRVPRKDARPLPALQREACAGQADQRVLRSHRPRAQIRDQAPREMARPRPGQASQEEGRRTDLRRRGH